MVFKRYLFCLHLFAHTSFALIISETYSYICLRNNMVYYDTSSNQTMEALFSDLSILKYYTLRPSSRRDLSQSFLLTGITSLTFIHRLYAKEGCIKTWILLNSSLQSPIIDSLNGKWNVFHSKNWGVWNLKWNSFQLRVKFQSLWKPYGDCSPVR